jgi:hypothetical protein
MPRIKATLPSFETDWKGQDDARSLMQAQEVQADPARHKRAQKHLKAMQDEHLSKAAAAMAAKSKAQPQVLKRPEHRKISKAITAMFRKKNR